MDSSVASCQQHLGAWVDILANDVSIAVSRQIGLWQFVGTGTTLPQQRAGGSCCSLCSNTLELRGHRVLFIHPREFVEFTNPLQIGCRS